MKLLSFSLISALSAAPASVCNSCPSGQVCFFATTPNTEFIECADGIANTVSCPSGAFYNDALKQCTLVSSTNNVPSPPVNICANCANDVECYYSVAANQNQYIQCSNGATIVMNCPAGLVWDSELNVCNWPPHVTYCDQQCPNTVCLISSPDSNIQYYSCPSGLQNCPVVDGQQTVWSQSNLACVCAECVNDLTSEEQGATENSCTCANDSYPCFFAGASNKEFVECCNGQEKFYNCPSGYFWNNGKCSQVEPSNQSVTVSPEPVTNICANCAWDVECYYSTTDASEFIQCSNGQPITQHCPSGTFWNNSLDVCASPTGPSFCSQNCPNEHCLMASADSDIQYYNCPSGLENCPVVNGQQTSWNENLTACVCSTC